jgi:PAS domain S-box-containing protein
MPEIKHQDSAILIVDDEESLRSTFQFFLKHQGYGPVITAASFQEAVHEIRQQPFDLIISDIVLEGESGIDFLRKVREMGIDCPVVMVTGYPNVETAAEAVRLGAFDYIPKPVEKETLLKTARLALQQRRLEMEKNKAELERERYRSFLETVFKSVTDAVVTIDTNLNIKEMNPAAKILFNELHPGFGDHDSMMALCGNDEFHSLKNNLLQVLQKSEEATEHRLECHADGGRGAKKVLSISSAPLRDGSGGTEGVVMVLRDMTPQLPAEGGKRSKFHRFIGQSNAMQAVYTMIENVGQVDLAVLITGESGTGKELAAEALHLESRRRERALVKVDCTAIPENLLESELFGHKKGSFTGADQDRMGRILQADGGTLFLDEIGDISTMMQLRLLRFLQENTFYPVGRDTPIQVDVRIIAATNADLKNKVRQGTFREDLYFRLRVIDVILPALRERGDDIILLANHFIDQIARKIGKEINGMSEQTAKILKQYPWPGNVRELEHVMERTCVLCQGPTIVVEHLPREIVYYQPAPAQNQQTASADSSFAVPAAAGDGSGIPQAQVFESMPQDKRILFALTKAGGNKAKAARLLGIDRTTLYRKIKELNLDLSVLDI